jgi:hypothetical protein
LTNRIDPLTEIVAEKIFGIAQTSEVDTARITELTLKEFQEALVADTELETRLNQRAKELRRSATAGLSDGRSTGGACNRTRRRSGDDDHSTFARFV